MYHNIDKIKISSCFTIKDYDEGFTDIKYEPSCIQFISDHHGIMYFIIVDQKSIIYAWHILELRIPE